MSILSIWLLSLVTSTHVLLERDVCGRECLRQVAAYWEVGEKNKVDDLLKTSAAPFSFADLTRAANEIGLHAEPVHWKDPSAARFPCPAILHVRAGADSKTPDHFIVCFGERDGKLAVSDGTGPLQLIPPNRLTGAWDGNALYVSRDPIQWKDGFHVSEMGKWGLIAVGGLAAVTFLALMVRTSSSDSQRFVQLQKLPGGRSGSLVAVVLSFIAVTLFVCGSWRAGSPPFARHNETPIRVSMSADNGANASRLIADAPEFVFRRKGATGEKSVQGKVRIRNAGLTTATISELSTSCSCLTCDNIVGKQIEPGGILEFGVHVDIPAQGAVQQALNVRAAGEESTVTVTVRVPDGEAIPRILKPAARRTQFDRLGRQRAISFTTMEEEGETPWISGLKCSRTDFRVDGAVQIEETPKSGYQFRTYSADIVWDPGSGADRARDIYGKAIAIARDGETPREIEITTLIAHEDHPCQPSVVILNPVRPREVVVCGDANDDAEWIIAQDSNLPEWVAVNLRDTDSRRVLEVSLKTSAPDTGTQEFELQIKDRFGRLVTLPVRASFEHSP